MKNKILLVSITIILCVAIYKATIKETINYVALGDSSCKSSSIGGARLEGYNQMIYQYIKSRYKSTNYNDDYCMNNYNINELIEDIYSNKSKNKHHILNVLDEADYISIMIGFDELTSYKNVDNIKKRDFLDSYSTLLKLVRKSTKARVFVIGFYPGYFNKYNEINSQIIQLCRNNDMTYIDSTKISHKSDNFITSKNYKLNNKGNLILYELIKEKI